MIIHLFVKGKPLNVDFARRFVNCWRLPHDLAGVVEAGLRHQGDLVFTVGTELEKTKDSFLRTSFHKQII